MQLIDKIFALKLLGCEITEDTGRYYARGGYIKNNLKHEYWERVDNFVIDWNFVVEFYRKAMGKDTYLSIDFIDTPENKLTSLIEYYNDEEREDFTGMKLYDKSKQDEPK